MSGDLPRPSASRRQAPGALAIVQDFVNTADLETGADRLADPAMLAAWLAGHGLAVEPADAGAAAARALREAVRAALLANNGVGEPEPAAAELRTHAGSVWLRPEIADDGTVLLAPTGRGLSALAGLLLGAMHDAQRDGTWSRLKACPAARCRWAFYDFSRNRTGTWCAMSVCGARAKSRAYQSRRRGAGAGG